MQKIKNHKEESLWENNNFMRVEDVAKELGISKSYAYKIASISWRNSATAALKGENRNGSVQRR